MSINITYMTYKGVKYMSVPDIMLTLIRIGNEYPNATLADAVSFFDRFDQGKGFKEVE